MCLKPYENQLIFMLVMFSTERRMMKARIPKPISGHLDRSFFFWCPEVGLGIPNLTSGRLDRSFSFWCAEVGLGIPKRSSGHLDRSFFLGVQRFV